MSGRLRQRIHHRGKTWKVRVGGAYLAVSPWLEPFYRRRQYRPAWMGWGGALRRADELLRAVAEVEGDGLNPQDYRLGELRQRIERLHRGKSAGSARGDIAETDLLLTNAFLHCAAHLQRGRVRAEDVHREWRAKSPPVNLAGLLQTALDLDRVAGALAELRPSQPGYARLRRVLQRYRRISVGGEWPHIAADAYAPSAWRPETVHKVWRRLSATGDIGEDVGERDVEELRRGLRRFQNRHGREPTGQLDEATLEALNVPLQERLDQIISNMERWRWLPRDPKVRYILVRLADFELDALEAGQIALNMRVIAGKEYWRTPIFSCTLTHLVFNPHWYVPKSIAVAEILPQVRRDPGYLERRGFRLVQGEGQEAHSVSVHEVDWSALNAENFPLRLTQAPGPNNPLGRVKFALPNPFGIYLHDTPDDQLFERRERYLSHGCIRLEKSGELAEYLLRDEPGWTEQRVSQALAQDRPLQVNFSKPVPVYLVYWTAWVDEDGAVQFRSDLYGEDRKLRQVLGK